MRRFLISLFNKELRACNAELRNAKRSASANWRRYMHVLGEKSDLLRQLSETVRERDELRRQLGGQP